MEIELQNQNIPSLNPIPPQPQQQQPQFPPQPFPQQQPQMMVPQVIHQTIPPNCCERLSSCLLGTRHPPLTVFIILMLISLNLIISLFIRSHFYGALLILSNLGLIFFSIFIWAPLAIKMENSSSSVRYGSLFFINYSIISLICFRFPFLFFPEKIGFFILFETLLISFANKDKKIKFFFCKITGKKFSALVIIYYFIFNYAFTWNIIFTIIYTFIYKKWLMKKFVISNERVERMENWCFIRWFKNNFETFITLQKSSQKKIQPKNQPQIQQSGYSINSMNSNGSFFAYPSYYYSGGIQPMPMGMPQPQPMQPIQPPQGQAHPLPPIMPPVSPSVISGNNNGNINMAGEINNNMNSSYRNLNGNSYMSLASEVNNQA